MRIKRRLFLEKLGLSLGVLAIPNFGWSTSFLKEIPVASSIIHLGSGASQFDKVAEKAEQFPSPVTFITKASNIDLSSNLKIDAALYGTKLNGEINVLKNRGISWVNSFIEPRPPFVHEFLITERLGGKIGVLGLDFEGQNESVLALIEKLNGMAFLLKNNLGCEQVFCLVNAPKDYLNDSHFEVFVGKTEGVDLFFMESESYSSNNLLVFPDKNKKQIMLSINTEKNNDISNIEFKNNSVVSFNRR